MGLTLTLTVSQTPVSQTLTKILKVSKTLESEKQRQSLPSYVGAPYVGSRVADAVVSTECFERLAAGGLAPCCEVQHRWYVKVCAVHCVSGRAF